MVEQIPVKDKVAGSNPAAGAFDKIFFYKYSFAIKINLTPGWRVIRQSVVKSTSRR